MQAGRIVVIFWAFKASVLVVGACGGFCGGLVAGELGGGFGEGLLGGLLVVGEVWL